MTSLEYSRFAESAFHFVEEPAVFEDFCRRSETEDLSFLEYIQKYKLVEFEEWLRLDQPQLYKLYKQLGS